MIKALENSMGVLVNDPNELRAMASEFYQTLYTSDGVQGIQQVIDQVPRKVTDVMNDT